MAKINFGQTVNDARGKLGGTVFSKNKSGAYTRRKVTPANPRSTAQQFVRNNFSVLSRIWSGTLTQSQRDAWIAYAVTYPRLDIFGASIRISGLNMFVSLNQRLLQVGAAQIAVPPVTNVVAPINYDFTSFTFVHPGTISFDQAAVAPTTTSRGYLFLTRPMPPGRTAQKSDFRFFTAATPLPSPYPATFTNGTSYVPQFGAAAVGQKITALMATLETLNGLVTAGVRVEMVVT